MIDPRDIDQSKLPVIVWVGLFGSARYRVVLVDEGEDGPACVVESEARDSLGSDYWRYVDGDFATTIRTVALMSLAAESPDNEVRIKKPEPVAVEPPPEPPPDHFADGLEAGAAHFADDPPNGLSNVDRLRWLQGHQIGAASRLTGPPESSDDDVPF